MLLMIVAIIVAVVVVSAVVVIETLFAAVVAVAAVVHSQHEASLSNFILQRLMGLAKTCEAAGEVNHSCNQDLP